MKQTSQPPQPPFPSFAIGIPTLNRWDLLRPSLEQYTKDFPTAHIYVLDNGNQDKDFDHFTLTYLNKKENIGVAASWNELCKVIFTTHNYALILNDDICLGKKEHEIRDIISRSTGKLLTTMKDFSAFILPKSTYREIGTFDENFKCYYEDSDYCYRLRLHGFHSVRMMALTPVIYRECSTSNKEPAVHNWALQSKQYYIKKWGGMPGQEKFRRPFNDVVNARV